MTGRLQKLREQRDLIFKHLQWIETEIASEEPDSIETEPAPEPPPPSPLPPASDATPVPESIGETFFTPELLETPDAAPLQSQVRRGCLIYFGLAWLLLAAVAGFIYLTYS